MANCYKCSQAVTETAIFRSTSCPKCHSDWRCCLMCQHYSQNAYNGCKEPRAERQLDKAKGNFCDFFHLNSSDLGAHANVDPKAEALRLAEALFKKKN